MLLRRSTTYALFLAIGLSAAVTFFLIRSGSLQSSRLPLDAADGDLTADGLAGRQPVRGGKAVAGGSSAQSETDAEFGILPIGLGSPVEHDMLEEDGIAFIPDRPEGSDLPPSPPPSSGSSGLHIESVEPDQPRPKDKHPSSGVLPLVPADFPHSFDSALLASRLAAFLARPILSHAAALAANIAACPLAIHDRQVNPDQLRGERDNWKNISEADVEARRRSLVKALERASTEGDQLVGDPKAEGGGRGIVVAGGNRDTTARIFALLRILRKHHKSTLPVQIFHFPGEITDGNERKELEALGAELVQFEGVAKLNQWKNFQVKALSILKSKFDEVLYLDSDNVPLADPAFLFKEPGYLANGRAVFWPDINRDHPENAIFRILGETCKHAEWQIDSGQIVIDKRGNDGLNLAALHLANAMQVDHEFWFKLSGGDKDTFRYAFHMLDIDFLPSPRWLSSAGGLNPLEGGRFCGNTMLQYDLSVNPKPLFLHANLLKHVSGARQGNTFTHVKTLVEPTDEAALDQARMWVYEGRGKGMCVDLEQTSSGKAGGVQVKTWEEAGGPKGFETLFYQEGGRAGGW